MRLLVDDVLRSAGIHVTVTLELENQIENVDQQQDNARAATDFESLVVCGTVVGESRVECSREQQAHDSQTEHACAHLGDRAVVDLFLVSETSQKEGHSQNQKKIGEDRPQQCRLDDSDLIADQ